MLPLTKGHLSYKDRILWQKGRLLQNNSLQEVRVDISIQSHDLQVHALTKAMLLNLLQGTGVNIGLIYIHVVNVPNWYNIRLLCSLALSYQSTI